MYVVEALEQVPHWFMFKSDSDSARKASNLQTVSSQVAKVGYRSHTGTCEILTTHMSPSIDEKMSHIIVKGGQISFGGNKGQIIKHS